MGRIAFVFSGQGDQYPGMGKDLYENYPSAADVFLRCEALRPGTMAQCFEGTKEELRETNNTQPCLFAVEMAAFSILREMGIKPAAVAGFSLGEVAAATAAGVFDGETGFRLVCKRGELMQREAKKQDTAMAAVVKLSTETVSDICKRYPGVYPVNFNCPGQIAVSGLASQMKEFSEAVRAAGGRALPLNVKGAFHSPFMNEAANAFAKELLGAEIRNMHTTLYSNVTAAPYTENVVELMSRQICSPVQWENMIRNMIGSGIDTFIEIGPGKTLTNMIRKIDDRVHTYSVSDLSVLLSEVKPC